MEPTQTPEQNAHFAPSPRSLAEFVGQNIAVNRLEVAIKAALRRKTALGHLLIVGPPDNGKSTLAALSAREMGANPVILNANTCGRSFGDFAGILAAREDGDVFILEDVQVLDKRVADFISEPLKDFMMSIIIDQGPNARPIRLNLPLFTFIATATNIDRLPAGFISSFKTLIELDAYEESELAKLAIRFASLLNIPFDDGAGNVVAQGCRTPREVLNRTLELRDHITVQTKLALITPQIAANTLALGRRTNKADDLTENKQRGRSAPVSPLSRRYQVFVSSTYEDLKEERRHVMQALLETKCIPTGMELFPAANAEQWKLIQQVIDDSDYYVVIVGGRYGTLGPSKLSYTEMEFDYAMAAGKPILGFYHRNPDELPAGRVEKNQAHQRKLRAFLAKVQKRICKSWSTPEGLASAIKTAILHAIENDPKAGWIRARNI